jgi:hypothetical protein
VKGGDVYGNWNNISGTGGLLSTFPIVKIGGPKDVGQGRLLSTTAVDQYAVRRGVRALVRRRRFRSPASAAEDRTLPDTDADAKCYLASRVSGSGGNGSDSSGRFFPSVGCSGFFSNMLSTRRSRFSSVTKSMVSSFLDNKLCADGP